MMKEGRESYREYVLLAADPDAANTIEASGALRLTLQDILPTVNNSLKLPENIDFEMGVEGIEIYPVSADDVYLEEVGETTALNDQTLNFRKIQVSEPVNVGAFIEVSNRAIDNAGFDLLGFIREKYARCMSIYLAKHLYGTTAYANNAGPFSSSSSWAAPSGSIYESIMAQMTALHNAGFDIGRATIVMDFDMEARLKVTPIVPGGNKTVISDGLCCGFKYIANGYFNTSLVNGALVRNDADAIGIALFDYWKIAQHGKVYLTIDGVSENMAKSNKTTIVINTDWSFTDLSKGVNGSSTSQAFKMIYMERGYLADVNDLVLTTVDGEPLTVGV